MRRAVLRIRTFIAAAIELSSPANDVDPPGPTVPATAVAATAASPGCVPSVRMANIKQPATRPTEEANEERVNCWGELTTCGFSMWRVESLPAKAGPQENLRPLTTSF